MSTTAVGLAKARNDHLGGTSGRNLDSLLADLADRASRPLEEAEALPADFYLSEALYEREVDRIFKREWLYICRADEIADTGDWYSADIAGEPILVVRTGDGSIRALSRVCAHRFADVLTGQEQSTGTSSSFVCPYHSWAYDLSGNLTGAPLMSGSQLFRRERDELCLKSYATEVWQGFVFVNLDPEAHPLAPRFAEMEEVLAPYRLDEWRVLDHIPWPESPVSWKVALDNGSECYHHQGGHLQSVEPLWPANLVDADTTESEYFYYQRLFIPPEAAIATEEGHLIQPVVLPPLKSLTPYERSHSLLVGIFPTMWFAPSPDVMFVAKWWPTGPQSHQFKISICAHQDQLDNPDLAKAIEETKEWGTQIQGEDNAMVTSVQRMLRSSAAKRGGPLAPMERPLWQFQKYMANRLAGASL